jgi:hypothetical protein
MGDIEKMFEVKKGSGKEYGGEVEEVYQKETGQGEVKNVSVKEP